MPKPRTKRSTVREERKRKHKDQSRNDGSKRQRISAPEDDEQLPQRSAPAVERDFFGLLSDEEQEYFRSADEMMELNEFPSAEDRDLFIDNVYREAKGKELKLASSQSCSRLMERLIQLSTTAQKKHLFEAWAGHFLSLVQHRFASHCCEALFLRSAGVVSHDLAGFIIDTKGHDAETQEAEASMESLFLATLDELEGSLSYLVVDRFASHALRALLLVLSGRPLEEASTRSLVKSRKKENVWVAGSAAADSENQGQRVVPASFTRAVVKIIADTTASLDVSGLALLARHPMGNPTLQLLLTLDIALDKSETKTDEAGPSLLYRLLPGAPASLADASSEASQLVSGLAYDPIGSRLVETLVAQCPGKVFRQLNRHIFLPRIEAYVRNDISSYPAIKVLARLSKDDLVEAIGKIAPTVPQLVAKSRFNVLKTLFERCAARGALNETKVLMRGLREGCGRKPADLVTTLCCLGSDGDDGKDDKTKSKGLDKADRNEYAIQSHGAQLLSAILAIPGPAKGVHEALTAVGEDVLLKLAMASMPTVTLLTDALSTPSTNSCFQKTLVATLTKHVTELATSQFGHNLVKAVASVPSKGKDLSVPYHVKEVVMDRLGASEAQLRESWMGRSVWRSWKGDLWKTRRGDWRAWMREPVVAGELRTGEAKK
ncbi:Armadillo-type fold protein [Ophiocordyceps camponoti-floridani]|uniref:Nucleolar protein 9 n=1 Tax=Ophiocordyceps camponoti-floridani TaxID=2030778 RepID=A0A8H4VCV5_9HYPO|nr:Armadillo-type fold protein [Ophiocordyceps camponoti-floridani]